MSLEKFSSNQSPAYVSPLAERISQLSQTEFSEKENIVEELEAQLHAQGYELGTNSEVMQIFSDPTLVCRSDSFSKVLRSVSEDSELEIQNPDGYANMCAVAQGEGMRIAMQEGFGNKDTGGRVKTVLTFNPVHLSFAASIPKDNELWTAKPKSAAVSLAGAGEVYPEDIVMVSFRFPIQFYPESFLTDSEKDKLDDENISFVVRHYIRKNKVATLQ